MAASSLAQLLPIPSTQLLEAFQQEQARFTELQEFSLEIQSNSKAHLRSVNEIQKHINELNDSCRRPLVSLENNNAIFLGKLSALMDLQTQLIQKINAVHQLYLSPCEVEPPKIKNLISILRESLTAQLKDIVNTGREVYYQSCEAEKNLRNLIQAIDQLKDQITSNDEPTQKRSEVLRLSAISLNEKSKSLTIFQKTIFDNLEPICRECFCDPSEMPQTNKKDPEAIV